jgi:two-component system response regulator FixJ
MSETPGTVLVVDDDDGVRQSLAFLLRSARLPVETYASATEVIAKLPADHAGCIITDVRMPGMSGIDLLRHVRALPQSLPVIIITGHGDVPLAVEAMKYGAVDFFEKPFDDDALLKAVRAALDTHHQTERQDSERADIAGKLASLTARERQVLDGLVAGRANKIIAFDLSISPRTVEIYRANVMTKMQAQSLSDLVRMALQVGLLNRG